LHSRPPRGLGDDRGQPLRTGLCAFAGLRLGEAAGLRGEDIDFLRRTLTVTRQVQRAGRGQVEVRPPKYGSERVVFLAPGLVEMLAAHIAGQDAGGGWMFTGEGDQPPHQNTVGHRWRTATTAAGVSGLRLQDLRHFYASGLIASGCDVVTVQRALGHSSATTTLSTYSHLWPSAEDRTRAAAQALLAEARGPEADRSSTGDG
jgi:integrase